MRIIFYALIVFSIQSAVWATVKLNEVHYQILIPVEQDSEIDPLKMNVVSEKDFNDQVMPQILDLKFYSYEDSSWHQMPYDYIADYCFARRVAVDAFLWFGEPLQAQWLGRTPGGPSHQGKYLLPGFINKDFKKYAWIETAHVNVIGKLSANNDVRWNNHEAVAVNTDEGIRVVDPSFGRELMTLEEWFSNFAPEESEKKCQPASPDMIRKINLELVRTQQFKQKWNPAIPYCGYVFKQRLSSSDMVSDTWGFEGTEEEKFLSAKFFKYFEHDMLKRY